MRAKEYFKLGFRYVRDCDGDYRILAKWYQDPDIYKNFKVDKRLNIWAIQDLYAESVRKNGRHRSLFYSYEGKIVGVITYKLYDQHRDGFLGIDDELIYEMDAILGEMEYLPKNVLRMALEVICFDLEEKNGIDRVVMAVYKENIPVIKQAKKAGFRKCGSFEHNGREMLILEYYKMYFENNDPRKKIVI